MHSLRLALLGTSALLMLPDGLGAGGGPDPAMTLLDAINSLDPDVDANWTEGGLPDVDVIERLTGNKWISRGDIEGVPITRSAAAERKAAGAVIVQSPISGAPVVVIPADGDTLPPDQLPGAVPAPDGQAASGGAPQEPAIPPDQPPADNDHVAPGATPFPEPAPTVPQKIGRHRIVELSLSDDTPLDGNTTATGLVVKVLDDGALNVWAFPVAGGAIQFFTGVRNKVEVEAMPESTPAEVADKNTALVCTWDWPTRT